MPAAPTPEPLPPLPPHWHSSEHVGFPLGTPRVPWELGNAPVGHVTTIGPPSGDLVVEAWGQPVWVVPARTVARFERTATGWELVALDVETCRN